MKYLHTMVRVADLDVSLDFYCNKLGLVETRRKEIEAGRFTLIFLAPPGDGIGSEVELTYNWDTDRYDLGNGFGHIAIEVDNVYKACEKIKKSGGKVTREAGPMRWYLD